MRKKRNINTNNTIKNNTENTITNTNTSIQDNITNINNDKQNTNDNNVYNDNNEDNNNSLNNLCNNEENKEGVNNYTKKRLSVEERQEQRKQLWKQVPPKNVDIVIKTILKQLPELKMQPQRIVQYLRLLYVSNQKHITALEKIQKNTILSSKDVLPVDDTIKINPVFYPKIIETIEVDQILNDKQSAFLNNIRNNIDKKQALEQAGYSACQVKELLQVVCQPNPEKFKVIQYKPYKKLWIEYWKIKKEQSEATGITEDYILSGLKKTADFNLKTLFDDQGNYKNINDLDDETAKQITEIKISEAKTRHNKTRQTTTTTRTLMVKVGNKDHARKELAKLQQGIFNHVNNKTMNINHNHSGQIQHGVLDVNKLNDEQLNKILMIEQQNEQLQIDNDCYDNEEIVDAEIIIPE